MLARNIGLLLCRRPRKHSSETVAILAALLLPALAKAKEKARIAQCKSNEHQLSLATIMYAGDNHIFQNTLGGARRYRNIPGPVYPLESAHLNGAIPAGGNITFLDGHIEWRNFSQMTNWVNQSGGNPGFVF